MNRQICRLAHRAKSPEMTAVIRIDINYKSVLKKDHLSFILYFIILTETENLKTDWRFIKKGWNSKQEGKKERGKRDEGPEVLSTLARLSLISGKLGNGKSIVMMPIKTLSMTETQKREDSNLSETLFTLQKLCPYLPLPTHQFNAAPSTFYPLFYIDSSDDNNGC